MREKLILLKDIEELGKAGDAVSVVAGYARNYLLPKKLALKASKSALKQFEAQKEKIEAPGMFALLGIYTSELTCGKDNEKLNEKIAAIRDNYKDEIKEAMEFLSKEESPFEPHMIEIENVPDSIPIELLSAIEKIITD